MIIAVVVCSTVQLALWHHAMSLKQLTKLELKAAIVGLRSELKAARCKLHSCAEWDEPKQSRERRSLFKT